jgi:hypothetical protein
MKALMMVLAVQAMAQEALSYGPQRQVFVAEIEERATFKTLCMGTFTLLSSKYS